MKKKIDLEDYQKRKIENILQIISTYNAKLNPVRDMEWQFPVDPETFDIEKSLCRPDICKNCGSCCRYWPCIFAPSDFLDLNDEAYMRELFRTGILSIELSGLKKLFVIRPRGIDDFGRIVNLHNYPGTCVLLGKNGCMLPPIVRPTQGLLYVPFNGEHLALYGTDYLEEDYKPYQETLKMFAEEYQNWRVPNRVHPKNAENFTRKLVQYTTKKR